MLGAELDGTGLWIEPFAKAIRTDDRAHVFFHLAKMRVALRIAVLGEQLRDDSFPHSAILVWMVPTSPRERNVRLPRAPQPFVAQ